MTRAKKRSPRVSDVPIEARRLLELPNVGPATALDLVRLGISEPAELARRDPDRMYDALCKLDGVRHDPCLLDVFASIVAFANGAPARPWWAYTAKRKARKDTARAMRTRRA
jgi:Pathogenicity locus